MSDTSKVDSFDLAAGVPGIGDSLRPKPKFSDRISKRVLLVLFGFIALLVAIFLTALNNMGTKPAQKEIDKKKSVAADVKNDDKQGLPDDIRGTPAGAIGKALPVSLPQAAAPAAAATTTVVSPFAPGQASSDTQLHVPGLGGDSASTATGLIPKADGPPQAHAAASAQQQSAAQEAQARVTRMTTARTNGLSARSFDDQDSAATGGATAGIMDALKIAAKNAAVPGNAAIAGVKPPETEQDEKLGFLKSSATDDRAYLQHSPVTALSPNEVKMGTYIPMSLEQGINSDLPGEITARVTEAVYDTISGCRLLIPAMSKAVGKYDSKVALGQGRMLVVWNSLIFPNGDELNLGGMQGYDTAGEAGLNSDVDNHYMRLIGLTFGMSMITSGVQLSVPQSNTNSNNSAQTPSQIIAASLAQQYGQLGAQIISKYMAVQPTLRNSPGERFMIMVPHTIVFNKVWQNRCNVE